MSAFAGRVAFSRWDKQRRRFRLVIADERGAVPAPVEPRRTAFDVDLGPEKDGAPIAVYSRCEIEQRSSTYPFMIGAGCDLFSYDVTTRRERRLTSTAGVNESEPAQWRGNLAYVRRDGRRRGQRGAYRDVHHGTSSRPALSRAVPVGQRGQFVQVGADAADGDSYEGGRGPIDLDLRGDRLGVLSEAYLGRCRTVEPEESTSVTLTELWVVDIGRRRRALVEKSCDVDPAVIVGGPTIGANRHVLGGPVRTRFRRACSAVG